MRESTSSFHLSLVISICMSFPKMAAELMNRKFRSDIGKLDISYLNELPAFTGRRCIVSYDRSPEIYPYIQNNEIL